MRPDFVGKQWLLPGQGFAYADTPPADLAAGLDDASDWMQLLAIFEQFKHGAFQHDTALLKLIASSDDSDVRSLGLILLGHAATAAARPSIGDFFWHADVATRMTAYEAALYCGDLRLFESLLLACRNTRRNERLEVMHALSHLLEAEPDQLYDDSDVLTIDAYERCAQTIKNDIIAEYGAAAVFEGRPLSLPYVLDRIKKLCSDPEAIEYSGTISMYFDLFEAMTGRSCAGVFSADIEVDPHHAIGLIEDFCESGEVTHFVPGHRYFFGLQLPS